MQGDTMSDNNLQEFASWLQNQHDRIMSCEDDALKCLDKGDTSGYAGKMREKATLLKDLDRESKAHLNGIPEDARREIESTLGRFSSSAATALSLDSVFFMSALLYRDDHKKGEPDNLAIFVESLKK